MHFSMIFLVIPRRMRYFVMCFTLLFFSGRRSLLHSFFSGDGIKKEGVVSFVPINISIASENDMPLTFVR